MSLSRSRLNRFFVAPLDLAARSYAKRLRRVTEAEELALLNTILTSGIDQGWFVRPKSCDLLGSPRGLGRVVRAADRRACAPEPDASDPFPDSEYPAATINGSEPGFIVLTQRCDLIRPLVLEPIVELAPARMVPEASEPNVILAARKNSARYVHLADHTDGAWVVDLRQLAFLPKDRLDGLEGVHPIGDLRQRRRLALRVGQRRDRTPVPTEYVDGLQRPLVELMRKPSNRKLAAYFSEFIGIRLNGKVKLFAVIGEGKDRREAEDAFEELFGKLKPGVKALLHDDSGAFTLQDINFWTWLRAFKLDLDEITFSGKAGRDHVLPDY